MIEQGAANLFISSSQNEMRSFIAAQSFEAVLELLRNPRLKYAGQIWRLGYHRFQVRQLASRGSNDCETEFSNETKAPVTQSHNHR
jgi:hypothetical protein